MKSRSPSLPSLPSVKISEARPYVQLDDLVRLQFEARDFSLLPRQPVHSILSGRHSSRLRGRGLTFEELRDYRPGDDIRTMDWKATARLRKPHVRVYTEERERPVLLVIDQRTTMFFGSARTTKATAAAELAALGAWRVLDAGDRVGAVIFGDHDIVEIKPHRSRSNVLRICGELTRMNRLLPSRTPPTVGFNDALHRAARLARHDHLVVLATDYHGDDAETHKLATRLATHNDVLAALVYDPLGFQLHGAPGMEATDSEARMEIPAGGGFEQRFREAFQARLDQLRANLRFLRIPILPISTHEPVPRQVSDALGQRISQKVTNETKG